jgi:hypothetical protein
MIAGKHAVEISRPQMPGLKNHLKSARSPLLFLLAIDRPVQNRGVAEEIDAVASRTV